MGFSERVSDVSCRAVATYSVGDAARIREGLEDMLCIEDPAPLA